MCELSGKVHLVPGRAGQWLPPLYGRANKSAATMAVRYPS